MICQPTLVSAAAASPSSSPSASSSSRQQQRQARLRISQSEKLNRRRLFEHYLKLKAQRIPTAFLEALQQGQRVLHHSKLPEDSLQVAPGSSCQHLTGTLSYAFTKLQHGSSSISVERSSSSTSSSSSSSSTQPNNVWKLHLSLSNFQADLMAQLDATNKECGMSIDHTSYGHVSIQSVQVTATVQLDGPNHQPQVIDVVDHIQEDHQVVIEKTNPTFQKLLTKVSPDVVEASIYEFTHSLFTEHLQHVIEGQLTSTTSKSKL